MTTTMGENIDTLLDDPWYTGRPNAPDVEVPGIYQVAIAGHGYIIDPAKYSRVTVPLRRESTDESVEPGEQTLNTSSAWRRSQDNYFLGAGQEFLDNRFAFVSVYTHSGEDPSVRTRFWRSRGVNPWVEGNLTLLPEYEVANGANGTTLMVAVGEVVYATLATGLFAFATEGSFTTITEPGGSTGWEPIYSITTDGTNLYVACGIYGVAIVRSGGTTSSWLRPAPPAAPAITNGGTPGSASYTYYVVGTDAAGFKSLVSAAGATTTGNASLTTIAYNLISWVPVAGMVSYDVLKTDTAHTIGTTTGSSFTDDGTHASEAYTAPTATTENFQATFVNYGNGFLLGGRGPALVSIGSNGSVTGVMTHFNPAWQWNTGCGSPTAIYIAGSAGGTSEIYGVQISTTNFALGSPYVAGQVSDGEIINDMLYYQGLVILGTSLGIRASQDTNSTGHLDTGPVITSLGPVGVLAIWGSFVWFGIDNYIESDGVWQGTSETSGLGRLALSQYSSPLIPAYATDVMSDVTGHVTGVTVVNGVPWFSIQNHGMCRQTGNVVEQGWLESGWVRYGTVEDKILISVDVRHDPLQGEVQMEIVPFGGSPILANASNEQGSTGPLYYISVGDAVGEAFMVIPILTRSTTDPTRGPNLRRWTARAMVTAVRQDQIVVPIIWKNQVLSPEGDGTELHIDLVAEWTFLKQLEQSGTAFIYQEGTQSYVCFIDQIEMSQPDRWNDQKEMLEGILSVKLLTVN